MSRPQPHTRPQTLTVAGPKVHWLSVCTMAFLVVFIAAIVALIVVDLTYKDFSLKTVWTLLGSRDVRAAIRLSAVTSSITLLLVILFAAPVGYALSRYRFPGRSIADTLVDLPIVMPPVVLGVSLLIVFSTAPGKWLEQMGFDPHSAKGIVLCQFLVSASYAIRASKSAFDGVDRSLENVALTLGCTHGQAFWRVALPLAKNGLVAGCIMAWARAVGVFGPLMVFVGSMRLKTEVMPTTIYLELTIGRIEVALAVAMMMLAAAGVALVVIHRLASGERWWGR